MMRHNTDQCPGAACEWTLPGTPNGKIYSFISIVILMPGRPSYRTDTRTYSKARNIEAVFAGQSKVPSLLQPIRKSTGVTNSPRRP